MNTHIQSKLEYNMVAKFAYVAGHKRNMETIKTKYSTLINSNLPCDMFNIIAALNINSVDELKTLFNTFTQRKLPFALWTGFSNETKKTREVISRIKLPDAEKEVGMVAHIDSIRTIKTDPSLVIKPATTTKHIDDIISVMTKLLPQDADPISRYFSEASDILLSSLSRLTFYIGYINDRPIATCSLYRDDRCAGI